MASKEGVKVHDKLNLQHEMVEKMSKDNYILFLTGQAKREKQMTKFTKDKNQQFKDKVEGKRE